MSIEWGRVVVAAVLMEVTLFAIAAPIFMSGHQSLLVYVIPPASLLATYGITLWLGRPLKSRFRAHGVLVGVVGTLLYVAVTAGQPEPWPYLLAHGLKLVGGLMAGVTLRRRAGRAHDVDSALAT